MTIITPHVQTKYKEQLGMTRDAWKWPGMTKNDWEMTGNN